MGMAFVQFYMNPNVYPHYSREIPTTGVEMECTPIGFGLRNGKLRIAGKTIEFKHANYLKITRDGVSIYGWVTDVSYLNDAIYEVSYSVDAWRTYRPSIRLGVQYIAREPMGNNGYQKPDPLLGSRDPFPIITTKQFDIGDSDKRVFVVQLRTYSGELYSKSPVQPTPYRFFMIDYPVNHWTSVKAIDDLMTAIRGAETENVVTMYSIPYADLSRLDFAPMDIKTANDTFQITGFKMLTWNSDPAGMFTIRTPITFDFPIQDLLYSRQHSVSVVVPEAGILNIPDELLVKPNLMLRQDVDLFSGASNYMITNGGAHYTQSIRGSSISSIPIVSDPLETYLSQNQNALATSMIGDVAMVAGGAAMAVGLPGLGAAMGGASAMTGVNNIIQRQVSLSEVANNFSNPPAFLGTALASSFSQKFWVVTTRENITNHDIVRENFGYPRNMVGTLTFPTTGFIQTEGCSVQSQPGQGVPKWAIDEINALFNNGILVHES